MTDKPNTAHNAHTKADAKADTAKPAHKPAHGVVSESQGHGTDGAQNPDPGASQSGLDLQGNFRVGERISLSVRGADIAVKQAHSGREVVVTEAALQDLLNEEYFTDHVG